VHYFLVLYLFVAAILASCGFDGAVLIHRETRPMDWQILYAGRHLHESSVNSVAFCPPEHGLMVAAASSDGRVSIISHAPDNSWSTEYIQDNPLGVNAVSWAPTGAFQDESTSSGAGGSSGSPDEVVNDPPRLVTGGCDNKIRFWIQDTSEGKWVEDTSFSVAKDLGHTDWVRDVAWSPVIVPGVNTVASCSEDRTVLIWTQNGPKNEFKAELLHAFDAPVWRVSWSVTGNILAVSSGDSNVTLWKQGIDGKWYQMESVEDRTPQQG
jgi:protein transport protein SEC13